MRTTYRLLLLHPALDVSVSLGEDLYPSDLPLHCHPF